MISDNKIAILGAIFVIAVVFGSFFLGKCQREDIVTPEPIIVIERDTIYPPAPEPIIKESEEYKKLYYALKTSTDGVIKALNDSLASSEPIIRYDTIKEIVEVVIPMQEYEYKDSSYKATFTAYNAHNFNIELYNKTKYIYLQATPSSNWSFGVQIGYGANLFDGQVRLSPFVGLGVSYRLDLLQLIKK